MIQTDENLGVTLTLILTHSQLIALINKRKSHFFRRLLINKQYVNIIHLQ
jgi:hypothetical protein